MPVILAVNDILRIRAVCYDANVVQLGECVTHWIVTAATLAPVDSDVAGALAQSWAPSFRAWIGTNAIFRGVGVQRIRPTYSPEVANVGFTGAGTSGGVTNATQIAGLIRHQSDQYYQGVKSARRRAQGRMYVPFPSVVWIGNPDPMSAAGKAALESVRTAIGVSKNIVGAGGSCSINLCTQVTEGPGPIGTKNAILSGISFISEVWATQRRRGSYGQQNVDPF